MKKAIAIVIMMCGAMCLFAQDEEGEPSNFIFVLGPRIGGSYLMEAPEIFSAKVQELYPGNTYFPVVTLFGITLEQRILLGQTKSHFAFQEVILVGGLEQGIALPEAAVLIGYRGHMGLEFGIGPILNMSGVGVVAAVGWTFTFRGAYIPVDISFIIPNSKTPATLGLTTGFNFNIYKKK